MSEYGITEERYFLILTAIWLSFITFYFLFTGFNNIKIIPMSLLLLVVIAAFGPISAFSVSQQSQLNRLSEILQRNNMMKDGKAIAAKTDQMVNEKDKQQINDIVDYLVDHFWTNPFQNYFSEKFPVNNYNSQSFATSDFQAEKEKIKSKLGIQFDEMDMQSVNPTKNFEAEGLQSIAVQGYDHFAAINSTSQNITEITSDISISLNEDSGVVTIIHDDDSVVMNLFPIAKKLYDQNHDVVPRDEFSVSDSTSNFSCRLAFDYLNVDFIQAQPKRINYFTGYLLWKRK